MQLAEGSRLGPYEILEPIGAGGMGEVYRARDTRLGRIVAIKALPAEISNDEKFRRRFEREAKAISSLQHPNICTLYDIGMLSQEGTEGEKARLHYLVMEHLEGETLAARLGKGRLSIQQVLRYGMDIAAALEKAHRQNVLHRDLKPSNIMLTRRGACLLDFGLAKFLHDQPAPVDLLADRSVSRDSTVEKPLTAEKTIIGTFEYAAPEQLEGKETDARSDLFALGVCLYEMVAGRRPFQGNTLASLITAILQQDPPPLSTLEPRCPPALEWLISMCLAKDPDERMQTAHDVLLELQRIAKTESRPVSLQQRWTWRTPGAVLAAGILIATAGWLALRNRASEPASVRRFSISLPPNAPLATGPFEKLAASPDGTNLVYVGGREPAQLYLHSLATQETRPIPGTQGARGPFFSSDGVWIGFYTAEGALKKVSTRGGVPETLSTGRNLRGASWGADNRIVFAELWSPLQLVSASGGQARAVTTDDPLTNVRWPTFLPGGGHVLHTVSDFSGDYENARLAVLLLKNGDSRDVMNRATYGRYVPPRHLLYLHGGTIYRVPFDRRAIKATGSPEPVVTDVDSYAPQGLAHFTVSSDGSLFYIPRGTDQRELVLVNRAGTATQLSGILRHYEGPRFSPDGTKVAVTVGSGPQSDLWLFEIQRNTWSRLTHGGRNSTPVWSPDGKQIVFSSNRNRGFNLFIMPSDGSAAARQITNVRSWPFPSSWSPDGSAIAVIDQHRETLTDVFMMHLQQQAGLRPLRQTRFEENEAVFSPDGRWIAYQSDESGRYEIYVQEYPGPGPKWLVSTEGGRLPRWRRDGGELFYRNGDAVFAVDVKRSAHFEAGKPRLLFQGDFEDYYDVAPDGRRFLMVRRTQETSVTQIRVVLGLFPAQDHRISWR